MSEKTECGCKDHRGVARADELHVTEVHREKLSETVDELKVKADKYGATEEPHGGS